MEKERARIGPHNRSQEWSDAVPRRPRQPTPREGRARAIRPGIDGRQGPVQPPDMRLKGAAVAAVAAPQQVLRARAAPPPRSAPECPVTNTNPLKCCPARCDLPASTRSIALPVLPDASAPPGADNEHACAACTAHWLPSPARAPVRQRKALKGPRALTNGTQLLCGYQAGLDWHGAGPGMLAADLQGADRQAQQALPERLPVPQALHGGIQVAPLRVSRVGQAEERRLAPAGTGRARQRQPRAQRAALELARRLLRPALLRNDAAAVTSTGTTTQHSVAHRPGAERAWQRQRPRSRPAGRLWAGPAPARPRTLAWPGQKSGCNRHSRERRHYPIMACMQRCQPCQHCSTNGRPDMWPIQHVCTAWCLVPIARPGAGRCKPSVARVSP